MGFNEQVLNVKYKELRYLDKVFTYLQGKKNPKIVYSGKSQVFEDFVQFHGGILYSLDNFPDNIDFFHLDSQQEFWRIKPRLQNTILFVKDDSFLEEFNLKKKPFGWKIGKLPVIANIITLRPEFKSGLHKDSMILEGELKKKGVVCKQLDIYGKVEGYGDVNFFLEKINGDLIKGRINVLIPNADFFYPEFYQYLDKIDYVLCKTKSCFRDFPHPNKFYIGWTSLVPNCKVSPDFTKFINVIKRSELLFETWEKYPDLPLLSYFYNEKTLPLDKEKIPKGIIPHSLFLSDHDFFQEISKFGIHLCLAEFEGFGHTTNEARALGCVPICINGYPMNELVNEKNGFLIEPREVYERYETMGFKIGAEDLYKVVKKVSQMDPNELKKMGQRGKEAFERDRSEFEKRFSDWFEGMKPKEISMTSWCQNLLNQLANPECQPEMKKRILFQVRNVASKEEIYYKLTKPTVTEMFHFARHLRCIGKFLEAYQLLSQLVNTFDDLQGLEIWYELFIVCNHKGNWIEGLRAFCEMWNRGGLERNGKELVRMLKFYRESPFYPLFVLQGKKLVLHENIKDWNPECPIVDILLGKEIHFARQAERKKIAIVCWKWHDSWDGEKCRKQGIGGSEECVVYLSEHLAKRGFQVTIYGQPPDNCLDRFPWSNPRYCDADDFDGVSGTWDYVIAWRQRGSIGVKNYNSRKIIGWEHDLLGSNYFSSLGLLPVSHTVWVSQFQQDYNAASHLNSLYNSKVVPNGVNISQFYDQNGNPQNSLERDPHRCIYASSYDRGLKHLLKLWPKIKKEFPEKRLDIYYGWNTLEIHYPEVGKELRQLLASVKDLDVVEHGRIGHEQLAKEFLTCSYWLYPCDFLETFCITAVKAQLAGAIPVYRNIGALQTTVKFGYKCDKLEDYMDTVRKAFNGGREEMRKEMKEWAMETYNWEKVTDQWVELLENCKEGKIPSPFKGEDFVKMDWKKLGLKELDQIAVELFYKKEYKVANMISDFLLAQENLHDRERLLKNDVFYKKFSS